MRLSIAFIICCRLSIYICFVDIAVAAKREFVVRAIVAFDDLRPHRAAGAATAGCWPNACVERHGGAEKALDSRGSPPPAGAESLKSTLWGIAPAVGTQKPEPWASKWRESHGALNAEGVVTIMAISSLDRLQARSMENVG